MSELRTSRVINQGSTAFDNITLDTNGSTRFALADGGGGTPVLFVNKANNRVGINNAAPDQALHVNGNIFVTGQIQAENSFILRSPNNTPYRITVTNGGVLGATPA